MKHKAEILYEIIAKSDNYHTLEKLSWTNQNFKHVFNTIFHLALEIDTKIEHMKNEMNDRLEYVECKHVLIGKFMDEVYITESVLKRHDWVYKVAKT